MELAQLIRVLKAPVSQEYLAGFEDSHAHDVLDLDSETHVAGEIWRLILQAEQLIAKLTDVEEELIAAIRASVVAQSVTWYYG